MKTESISQLILAKAQQFGPKVALCSSSGDAADEYTYRALDQASGCLAAHFIDFGLQTNDRIALLCESRPRWGVAFFATVRAGAILVPLDIRTSAAELAAILDKVKPSVLLVSRSLECSVADYIKKAGNRIRVMSMEAVDAERSFESIDVSASQTAHPCVPRTSGDAAIITYTSGTTGSSKGVITTFGNLLFQIRSFRQVMLNDAHCTGVSILPLSHLFELTAGFLGLLYGGGRICFCNSMLPDDIVATMRKQEVTCMVTVPLFLKLLASAIQREVDKLSGTRQFLFSTARVLSPVLGRWLRRKIFASIHERFGGKLEYFVSGGAPLDLATAKFFDAIGMPVYQGYGMAETSPVIATNGPLANRQGSVGKPLPGVEIRISREHGGEILTRGPHLMRGYFNDNETTAKMIDDDGWLHTGDIGYLDSDGFLFISGRKKNIIVLSSGKKVQPEEIEDALFAHPLIQEGCVIGTIAGWGIVKGTEEVCAVAVASEYAMARQAANAGNIDDELRKIIEMHAQDLSPCERPTRIVLRTEPLPRTSSRKIRRDVLRETICREAVAS